MLVGLMEHATRPSEILKTINEGGFELCLALECVSHTWFILLNEHLLEERLLQSRELVVLTLMKGDEVVEAGEEPTDRSLFIWRGEHK